MKHSIYVRTEFMGPNGVLLANIVVVLRELGLCPEVLNWTMIPETATGRIWLLLSENKEEEGVASLLDRLVAVDGVKCVEESSWPGRIGVLSEDATAGECL
jgi:hypothetical protein